MASLYELTGKYMEIMEILMDSDCSEQEIAEILENSETSLSIDQKAENYCRFIKNLESDITSIQTEIARLDKRMTVFQNRIKGLKESLKTSMEITGKTKITTDLFTISIQKNGGKRAMDVIADVEDLPEEMRIPQPDKADKDAIRKYTEEHGELNEYGDLVSEYGIIYHQTESLRIR